ncbi:MAG TPA: AMP-binding protein, partial [Ilumatobacteraceae bacterium]|nr:AMP-binding protein [Ilumatobacteraceae bacterium]
MDAWIDDDGDRRIRAAVAGQTVPRLFAATVARRPDEVAHRWRTADGWATWTWREYADHACRTATLIEQLGVPRGGKVALMLRNCHEFHPIDVGAYL